MWSYVRSFGIHYRGRSGLSIWWRHRIDKTRPVEICGLFLHYSTAFVLGIKINLYKTDAILKKMNWL